MTIRMTYCASVISDLVCANVELREFCGVGGG